MKSIILASASPRRKEILEKGNVKFQIQKAECEEIYSKHYDEKNVIQNSQNKAFAANIASGTDALIVAADTIVILNSVCLVKPRNKFEAVFMLKNLSGKTHTVVTSHTVLDTKTKKIETELSKSFVTFRKLNFFEIINYVFEKNPLDKAGSYGIQDFLTEENYKNPPASSFISKVEGSFLNVVGLDLDLVLKMLEKF